MQIRPLAGRMAAECSGVNVAALAEGEFERIYRAFLDHSLVVLREQVLEIPQLLGFAARFGRLRAHVNKAKNHTAYPELMELDNQAIDGKPADLERIGLAAEWHSDLGYEAVPAKATGLYARQLPSRGGNTTFNDMYAAYEALPQGLRQALDGRKAYFKWGGREGRHLEVLSPADRARPPVVHDIVKQHPETGRNALFVSPAQVMGIVGMEDGESRRMLDEVFTYTNKTQVDYSHTWRIGDIVIWDNRCLLHSATNDYPLQERRLHWRVTIMEDDRQRAAPLPAH